MGHSIISAIALDLGTTSIKAALMDKEGNLQHIVSRPAPAIDNQQGRYESNARQYIEVAEQVIEECTAKTSSRPPLGLCSQRSSFLIWNKASGKPVTPLISWQDDRGTSCCHGLQAETGIIHELTGLRLTPYYFAPKLSILLHDHPTWRDKLICREWLTGTLDTFLIWRWTHGQHFVTDASMAARTLLMDIHKMQWSDTLCQLFDIPVTILPAIKPSTGLNLALDIGLTLQASIGDQSAALIGSLAGNHTQALVNLGTGGFVIRPVKTAQLSSDGYLQTLLYQNKNQSIQFAIEGTLNSIAAALAPYPVQNCCSEDLATSNIFCLAEPSGLGAPYFRNEWGIYFSQSTAHLSPQQITALMLEAVIFRVARILEDFHTASPLTRAYLSGGLSQLSCLQQGIAQCVTFPVFQLQQKETSLQGAAMLACELKIKFHREVRQIIINKTNTGLLEKYQCWKKWLDTLLKN
ncbi:MAG: carbohydrate kinase [Nitrosomonas sp.]|nr:MAG: carbohydrate kinase [Nitrosomonas sp.]